MLHFNDVQVALQADRLEKIKVRFFAIMLRTDSHLLVQVCRGLLLAANARRQHFVPIRRRPNHAEELCFEDWVPVSFCSRFTCDPESYQFMCHPRNEEGCSIAGIAFMFVHENQSRRKLSHRSRPIGYMTNYKERWYGNILVVKLERQSEEMEWEAVDVTHDDIMQINIQILK
jgi:hypothetical protein